MPWLLLTSSQWRNDAKTSMTGFAWICRTWACAWNCLEVDDRLVGYKGAKYLELGARLRGWRYTNPTDTSMSRSRWSVFSDAKQLDRWLLVAEEKSGSFAHVDVAVAT